MPPFRRLLPLLSLLGLVLPSGVPGQEPAPSPGRADGWNAPPALELVGRARDARQEVAADPELRAYRADATGRVFFLVDRPDTERRTLVKADQIALEVYWRAPRDTRQRIVGLRDREVLPTDIHYHLDHLTVVQDDFGDMIRLGDGDEVSSVVHPLAPGAQVLYEYRLGDSLSIAFPGTDARVRVVEVQVRPLRLDQPGFIGSVFLDRGNAAVVRMTFTFTPASYVDRNLDYIRIALDNSLWEGRWWLPYRQEVEIRREIPALDFLAGSVIRGRFEIGDYEFNPDLPPTLFRGPTVTAVPESQRESYAFEEPLIPEDEAEELAPTPSLQEIRSRALELTAGRYLSGLSRLRLHLPSASDVFRWNRAEGTFLGLGAAWRPSGTHVLTARAGWAFGPDEPSLSVGLERDGGGAGFRARWRELRDLGPFPAAGGLESTLSALLGGEDWIDPWFASGVDGWLSGAPGGASTRLTARFERHDSARTVLAPDDADDFRPLPGVEEGWMGSLELSRAHTLPASLRLDLTARAGAFDPEGVAEPRALGAVLGALSWERYRSGSAPDFTARLDGGAGFGDLPPQMLFHLGGRGTLPGHPFRTWTGDAFWLARADATVPALSPWLSLRAFAAGGAVSDGPVRASAGPGVALMWDVLHVDLARGLDGGEWELVVSVDRRFRGWL